jgi:hypothetical protein
MEAAKSCRRCALQCFRWAASIEDARHHHIFTDVARDWLSTAKEVERDPEMAHETMRARLH